MLETKPSDLTLTVQKATEVFKAIVDLPMNNDIIDIQQLLLPVLMTCFSPRRAVHSHSLVCSKNYLLIVGIGLILNKELELNFRSDPSDRTCVYSYVCGLYL